MTKQEDGGAAFPRVHEVEPAEGKGRAFAVYPGMSLRDYFAAHATFSLLMNAEYGSAGAEYIAKMAYAQADAMIKARGE